MHAKPFPTATAVAAMMMIAMMMILVSPAAAQLKKVPYPAVKVELEEPYKPDAAFEKMRKAFIEATRNKDANALFALVAPGFVWVSDGALSNDFDPGRPPLHNFKVLFGFRDAGKAADGGVEGGPYWDILSAFAEDDSYYRVDQGSGLVCSPMAASVENEDALEQARKKIDTAQDSAEWYFVLRETRVVKAPGDRGLPVATASKQAFPVLNTAPPAREGAPAPAPTDYEVLLPSGKSGWIPAAAARPLETSRLCYALTEKGDWAIALYDSAEEDNDDED